MPQWLMVPMHLDALHLTHELAVAEALVDFSRLPYSDGYKHHNADVANLSKEILSPPFENQNLYLKPGIHLHWSLPDTLTRGVHEVDSIEDLDENFIDEAENRGRLSYPRVPNRWLITRWDGSHETQWMVESDYLHPIEAKPVTGATSFPLRKPLPQTQPFRYLGRVMPLAAWLNDDGTGDYLEKATRQPLTAMGYGEPTFAAFYPNCLSLFGFHDGEARVQTPATGLPADLRYTVVGWYADPDHDFLHAFLSDSPAGSLATAADMAGRLDAELKWTVDPALLDPAEWPERMLCFAQLTFSPKVHDDSPQVGEALTVTVGDTGIAALTAHLATHLANDAALRSVLAKLQADLPSHLKKSEKTLLEEQLLSLVLADDFANRRLDLGQKFLEARHEYGFVALPAGSRWVIRAASQSDVAAKADQSMAIRQLTLPPRIGHALNDLNALQDEFQTASNQVASLRRQIFADWYKYMLSVYRVDSSQQEYADPDEVEHFIRARDLTALAGQLEVVKTLMQRLDNQQGVLQTTLTVYNRTLFSGTLMNMGGGVDPNGTAYFSFDGQASHIVIDHVAGGGHAFYDSAGAVPALTVLIAVRTIHPDPGILLSWDPEAYWEVALQSDPNGNPPQLIWTTTDELGETDIFNVAAGIADGQWHSLAFVYEAAGAQKAIYVDGALVGQKEAHEGFALGTGVTRFGFVGARSHATHLGGEFARKGMFNGDLTGLKVIPTALPPVAVQDAHENPVWPDFQLSQTTAPRFWQPREPVVLLTGPDVKASVRHGHDGRLDEEGLLACRLLTLPDQITDVVGQRAGVKALWVQIRKEIEAIHDTGEEHVGLSRWEDQPWHPILLEWEAENHPIAAASNHAIDADRSYESDFITATYALPDDRTDLVVKPGQGATVPGAEPYSGRTVPTPHAGQQLQRRLEAYLERQMLADYLHSCPAQVGENSPAETVLKEEILQAIDPQYSPSGTDDAAQRASIQRDFAARQSELIRWYGERDWRSASNPLLDSLLAAYAHLLQDEFNAVSAVLSGYNEALLMRKQTLQLPIADPLGFADYQPFSDEVRRAVQRYNSSAPMPDSAFNPLRSGILRLTRLRLLDNFGRGRDLEIRTVTTTEPLTVPKAGNIVHLPPRIVQPARLNFRWLAADAGEQEMNDHPATSPICGWLLPNHLDNSLLVYTAAGEMIGVLTGGAQQPWQPAPGQSLATDVSAIANPYLKRVVKQIIAQSQQPAKGTFWSDFTETLDSALANIQPENSAQNQALALLFARPIAVVRAVLNLELRDLPAVHQGWGAFYEDLLRNRRETDDFTAVAFPIRLGEYGQLNDGLVGYWIEDGTGFADDRFYAPQSDSLESESDPNIVVTHGQRHLALQQTIDGPPHFLTMLVDPRGSVHATSGVLPTKAIDLPPDQFLPALQRIYVTFLTAPILTDPAGLALPLPQEPGYIWSWLNKTRNHWEEIDQTEIGPVRTEVSFSGLPVIREGWLKLRRIDKQKEQGYE